MSSQALDLRMSARLVVADDWGTFTGQVENDERVPGTFTGTVSRRIADSWDSPVRCCRYRVKLDGEWIPAEDLVASGPFRAKKSLDTWTWLWSFGVRGRSYSIFSTYKTWTRTPVEVYLDHGVPGDVIEAATPDYSGYVLTCDQDPGPVLRIQCADFTCLYNRYEACEEVPPGAGYHVGEIVRLFCGAAGIDTVEVPDGPIFEKPVQWVNKRLFPQLALFVEPQGWKMQPRPDGSLTFRRYQVKQPPFPADSVWAVDELLAPPRAIPPKAGPSRWVLNAMTTVTRDEAGIETERTVTRLRGLFAPTVADERQLTDGTTSPTGFVAPAETMQEINRVEDVVIRRGDKVIGQTTVEFGWYNPLAAKVVSLSVGAGTRGDGYNYLPRFMVEGEFVAWGQQRYMETGRRVTTHTYDDDGNPTQSIVDTHRFYRRTQSVSTVAGLPGPSLDGGYVYSDDQSYAEPNEAYGLAERQVIAYSYDDATGAQVLESQQTFRYYGPKSARNATNPAWHVLYDGTGQQNATAQFIQVELQTRQTILSRGSLVRGELMAVHGYGVSHRVGGAYDFGEYESDFQEEVFQYLRTETAQFNPINERQYERVDYPSQGGRVARIFLGSLPVARYRMSTWTRLTQAPLEVVLDDETMRDWFGFERQAFTHDYVQSQQEAELVLGDRRRRALSIPIEVARPASGNSPGDTIHLVDPDQGLDARCLVIEVEPEWDGPSATETYRLELPLC